MPRSSMSEQDREQLTKLLQGPLIPAAGDPKVESRPKVVFLAAMKIHLLAHSRAYVALAAVGICLVCLLVAMNRHAGIRGGSIQLHAHDRKGQLQIRWDPTSNPIRTAVGARLYIVDGSERLFVKLDSAKLQRGAVTYSRQSDRVELRLALAQPDGKWVEEQATFEETRASHPEEAPLEMSARPAETPEAPSSPAAASAPPHPEVAGAVAPAGHRTRTKPLQQSGTRLPFTCSPGDTFRKTDAPAGWDTFTCRGNNVWSIVRAQVRESRPDSSPIPNATTVTAKPAIPSTT